MAGIYSDEVRRRCQDAPRAGSWPLDDALVGTGTIGSLEEGTMTRVQVRVDPALRLVQDARYTVFGCSAAIASASLVADRLAGATLDTARAIAPASLADALALPTEKRMMASHAAAAARAAVEDWERKAGARDPGRGVQGEPLGAVTPGLGVPR